MKAISLKQPWAFLVVHGYKPIEFRYRRDKFRGECYVQASKTFDDWGYEWLLQHPELPGVDQVEHAMWCPKTDTDFGSLVGKITITDCISVEQANLFYPDEMWLTVCQRTLGDIAYIIKNPIAFPYGIPCKGKIAPLFFEVEEPEIL
jgi:hypothetical protein